MRKLIAFYVLSMASLCFGQGARWDLGGPVAGVSTYVNQPSPTGQNANYLVTFGPVTLNWCSYPANSVQGTPCTNFATTYTDLTLGTPCATNQPIVLQNSTTCQSSSDSLGNLGVYAASGNYSYTLTSGSHTYGPFAVTLGGSSGGSSITAIHTTAPITGGPVTSGVATIGLGDISCLTGAVAVNVLCFTTVNSANEYFNMENSVSSSGQGILLEDSGLSGMWISGSQTLTANVKGSPLEISAGESENVSPGQQGLLITTLSYVKGATNTQWNLQCSQNTQMQAQDCGASPTNILGVLQGIHTNTAVVVNTGEVPINASSAVTLGHTVCAGTTAGRITDSGGTGACPSGQAMIGTVIATAGNWGYPDTVAFTATTSLPLIQLSSFAAAASSTVGGSGTTNKVPLWTASTTLGNSDLTFASSSPVNNYTTPSELNLDGVYTSSASVGAHIQLNVQSNPTLTGSGSGSFTGAQIVVDDSTSTGTPTTSAVTGLLVQAIPSNFETTTIPLVLGGTFSAGGAFTANVTNSIGLSVSHGGSGGGSGGSSSTIANSYGLRVLQDNTSGTVTNDYSIFVATPTNTSATISNLDELHLSDIASSATTPIAIHQIGNAPNVFQGHLDQVASGNWAGSCAMVSGTTCTFSISKAYTGTPLSFVSIDAASAPPATAISAKCAVSSTTVTITAGASNSLTWDCLLIGNPN